MIRSCEPQLTQVSAARLMAAHENVAECMRAVFRNDKATKNAMWDRLEALGKAERAFAEMVAKLTDSEGL